LSEGVFAIGGDSDCGAKLSAIYHFPKIKKDFRNLTFEKSWVVGGVLPQILLWGQNARAHPARIFLKKVFVKKTANCYTMLNAAPLPSAAAEPKVLARNIPLKSLESASPKPLPTGKKIVLPTMEGLCFEKVKHIAYLEASGNYTVLHFKDKRQILVCKTLREVEQMLPEWAFARIHRSHTIHLKYIKRYVRGKGGHVVLHNGVTLSVSAGQKDVFMEALRTFFAN
jgi:DNA-binding LytR/AlgR family response regulator